MSGRIPHWLALIALLGSMQAHGEGARRCLRDGKVIITNVTCDLLGGATDLDPPVPSKSFQRGEPTRPMAAQAPSLPLEPPKPATRLTPPASTSVLQQIANTIAPLLIPLIVIVFLVAWLKHQANKAIRRRLSQAGSLAGRLFEPVITDLQDKIRHRADRDDDEELPYRQAPVMSRYELELFGRLKDALPECEVFPQTPLASFIQIDRQRAGIRYRGNSFRWQNRIGQQRVDFLVCLRQDMSILSAIELDDPSHEAMDAIQRDRKKDKSLREANVRLIRWRVESMPSPSEIRNQFLAAGLVQEINVDAAIATSNN